MQRTESSPRSIAKMLSTVSICLALMLCGCGKEKTDTAEQERQLDEKISAVNAEIAEARAAQQGLKQSSDLYRAAANKQYELSLQKDELQAQKDQIAKDKAQAFASDVATMADKLPKPDAGVIEWIAANSDVTDDGIVPLLTHDWIGTNSSGKLVGLFLNGDVGRKKEIAIGFLMSSGSTMSDIEERKQDVDPNTDLFLMGVDTIPAMKVRGYRIGDTSKFLEGVLLSTNRLRIYFPEKPLGTVDFYPMP